MWYTVNMTKYKKWYDSIISTAKKIPRRKHQGTYYEQHHIIPISLGGSNCASNLVLLTAKEHFVAHLLLMKFSKGVARHKMAAAFLRMSASPTKHKRYTSRSFTLHRREAIRALRTNRKDTVAVTIHGVAYSSKSEACRELGLTMYAVTCYEKNPDYVHRPETRVINGIQYASYTEAAKVLGVSPKVATRMVNDPTYVYNPACKDTRCPVTFRDTTYPSKAAAARALGVSKQTVLNFIARDGEPWDPKKHSKK